MRQQGGSKKDQQQAQRQRQSSSQQDGGDQKGANAKDQLAKSDQKPEGAEQVPNDRTTEGELPPSLSEGDLRDQQGRGRWGRLPKTVIQRMYDNGRRKLPEKYRILLEDYFRKLPEHSPR